MRDSNHAQARAKLFIVPRGQTTTTIYVEHKTQIGSFTFITREPQTINVQEYLNNQGYTIKIAEPVQGEGGFIVPPNEFIQGLRKICDENDILFIADEVQSGMGRTGKMFAVEHSNVVPDIIAMAKSLGGGLPLAATISRADVIDTVQVGGLGGTFGGNPLSCVAALKTIEIVQGLLDKVPKLGSLLIGRLREMQEKYEAIGDVRGIGLMVGVELGKDRKTKEPAKDLRDKVLSECHKNGLIIMGAGAYHNVIRFLPPLNISEELLNKGLDIFENAIKTSLTK